MQASNPKCHWMVVALAFTSKVAGSAKYKKAITNLFARSIFENRDERNRLAGDICIAIAHRFITNGAKEKGTINDTSALRRDTL